MIPWKTLMRELEQYYLGPQGAGHQPKGPERMQRIYLRCATSRCIRPKCSQWYFGLKAHGVNSQTKQVHSIAVTAANAYD